MTLPTSCAVCTVYQAGVELCRRHAPPTSVVKHEISKWPKREPTSWCAEGVVDKPPVMCVDCGYWWQPDGKPLSPNRVATAHQSGIWAIPRKHDDDDWSDSGLCMRQTASPSGETHLVHPRVTFGHKDGCGSGKTAEEILKAASAKEHE